MLATSHYFVVILSSYVKWKGFPTHQKTWYSRHNLGGTHLVPCGSSFPPLSSWDQVLLVLAQSPELGIPVQPDIVLTQFAVTATYEQHSQHTVP